MALTVSHAKTVTMPDPTQAELDAQIALGNYPAGTLLADIALQSDWNNNHTITGSISLTTDVTGILPPANGGVNHNIVTTTSATYNATSANNLILCNAASNTITVNLPAAASNNELELIVKKIDSSANKITIDANGAELIDGATTKIIGTQYTAFHLRCNGSAWYVI